MAQGRKYNNDVKEKAFALLATNNNPQVVADELNIPYSTIKTWEKKWIDEAENKADGGNKKNEHNLVELRKKKKEEFVEDAWSLIDKVRTLLERRLDRAITSEDKIDELVEEITQLDHRDLTDNQRKALYNRIAALKLDNVKELSVVLGTLYDKQALSKREPTQIVDNQVTVKFEDL